MADVKQGPAPPHPPTALPGSEAALLAFSFRGQLHLTVIAKATFTLVVDSEMVRRLPQPILRSEEHHGNNPARSVKFGSDLVPYLPRADVLCTGSAYAVGPPVGLVNVRLAVLRGDEVALEKRLVVRDSAPFREMPIDYERAVGGRDGQENPLGVPPNAPANVIDPEHPGRPAGFGPIARAWPIRKRLLGKTPRKALEGPLPEIPANFDWSYFQAAPVDQRMDHLRGDEWILLEGLHPSLYEMRTRLPDLRGWARLYGLVAFGVAAGHGVELAGDTLRIDGDTQTCTVVFRKQVELPNNESVLTAVRVVAGVVAEGDDVRWPIPAATSRPVLLPSTFETGWPTARREDGPSGTLLIEGDGARRSPLADPPRHVPARAAEEPVGDAPTLALDLDVASLTPRDLRTAPPPGIPLAPPSSDETLMLPGDVPRQALEGVLPAGWSSVPNAEKESSVEATAVPLPGAPWSYLRAAPASAGAVDAGTVSLCDSLTEQTTEDLLDATAPRGPTPTPEDGTASVAHVEPPKATPSEPPLQADTAVTDSQAATAVDTPRERPTLELDIGTCAAIAAELVERRVPRFEVLAEHGLSEARWAIAESRWSGAMDSEAKLDGHALRDAYDEAYVATWKAIRGGFEVADYARLALAAERGTLAATLDAMGMRRTLWLRLKRLYTRRLAMEPHLAAELNQLLTEARRTR